METDASALFVDLAKAAIADDVADQDGSKPTFHSLPFVRATKRGTLQGYAQ
jgi:hypothetical protein